MTTPLYCDMVRTRAQASAIAAQSALRNAKLSVDCSVTIDGSLKIVGIMKMEGNDSAMKVVIPSKDPHLTPTMRIVSRSLHDINKRIVMHNNGMLKFPSTDTLGFVPTNPCQVCHQTSHAASPSCASSPSLPVQQTNVHHAVIPSI